MNIKKYFYNIDCVITKSLKSFKRKPLYAKLNTCECYKKSVETCIMSDVEKNKFNSLELDEIRKAMPAFLLQQVDRFE